MRVDLAKQNAGLPQPQQPKGDLQATGQNSWFEVLTRDLGTYYGSGEATGLFPFHNPTDREI